MKLRLHWAEKYEVVREFPSFELDSEHFPELELEMLQVHNAGSAPERMQALDALGRCEVMRTLACELPRVLLRGGGELRPRG